MPILFDMDVNVKHYAGAARHYIMCSLCVAAAALLVLSNKILLSHLPSTGAPVLTLLHNLIGIIAPRACCRGAGRRRQSRAPCAQDVKARDTNCLSTQASTRRSVPTGAGSRHAERQPW